MSDLEAIRRAVIERRTELARILVPLTGEVSLLRRILEALEDPAAGSAGRPEPPPPARPPRPAPRPPASGRSRDRVRRGRSRRPQSGQTRTEQALERIAATPGITPADLAREMELHPQYLYRLLPQLVKAGQISKRGRGYRIADDAAEHDPRR